MSNKYDAYIELAPGYESVVDINSDSRSSDFWSHYIVNEDMVKAVEYIGKALRSDSMEEKKHFWIKGAYGTGKTYAAIVLKHLLQDDYHVVETFLNKNSMFFNVKDRFLAARKRGKYYVEFRSGECRQLNTSGKLLMQIERSVRKILKDNDFAYIGTESIIDKIIDSVKKFKSSLEDQFNEDKLPQLGMYDSFEEFYSRVINRNIDACETAQDVLVSLNINLATDLDTFKAWIKDVFDGNEALKNTGVFIIWDEFTEYIRNNDLDIIQQLSLLSKDVPLFIIYVMHEYPGLFSEDVTSGLGKADARFYKIDVALNEKTTLKLIGESILVKDGMKDAWESICNDLADGIKGNMSNYVGDPESDITAKTIRNIFPIHPMTVNLVSKVAGMAASNRSIFKFLKSSDEEGFRAYIKNEGPYDWKWVTPDYLWDYYFVNDRGGKKEMSKYALDALKHYENLRYQISDKKVMRVFKVAMLLLATLGGENLMLKAKGGRGIRATEKTICDCFYGMLSKKEVSDCLRALSDNLKALVLAPDIREGSRIELPYSGATGELDDEVEKLKKDYTPNVLFATNGIFGVKLKQKFASAEDRAVVKRLAVETCWGEKPYLVVQKLPDLVSVVEKYPYKFGMLTVVVPNDEAIERVTAKVCEDLADKAYRNKIFVAIIKTPLKEDKLSEWYQYYAQANLAQKTGNTVNASKYKNEAEVLIEEWISAAIAKPIKLIYDNSVMDAYHNKDIMARYEKSVLKVFPAAPEALFKTTTLYKTPARQAAYYGVARVCMETKNSADDKEKSFNTQWQNCVELLRDAGDNVWACATVEELLLHDSSTAGKVVGRLVKFIEGELAPGVVLLDEMWEKMQRELGYYSVNICGYLLGFAMKFYLDKYTWFDGSNSHKLDKDTATTMIINMLTGKATGMKLASESAAERQFKRFTCDVFKLNSEEAGDILSCKRMLRGSVTSKFGAPLWALKYLEDEKYGGIKDVICRLFDLYTSFILADHGESNIAEEVVGLIKPYSRELKKIIPLLTSTENFKEGMRAFVYKNAPQAEQIMQEYGFKLNTLITILDKTKEEEKWQWKEDDIADNLSPVIADMNLIGIVNSVFDNKAQTVEKTCGSLADFFDNVLVPGCVYEIFDEEWVKAVEALYNISCNKWNSYSIDEKQQIIKLLKDNVENAAENLRHPLNILKRYMVYKKMPMLTEAEYADVLHSLQRQSYKQTEYSFNAAIKNKLNSIETSKKEKELLEIWEEKTHTTGVRDWTDKYVMPITWATDCSATAVISAVRSQERVDKSRLDSALAELKQANLSDLCDKKKLDRIFICNVAAEKYVEMLIPHVDEIKQKIRQSGYYDCARWTTNIAAIRKITEKFIVNDLKTEVSEKAKQKVDKITDVAGLKAKLNKLLELSPEACLIILDEE